MRYYLLLLCSILLLNACSSSDIEEALGINDVPRKPIDVSRMGVNAFANDARFGSIENQYLEVRDVLGLSYVRILFAWNDAVQATPGAAPNFSFYDDIAASIPYGVDALVVVTGIPSWMTNSANWEGGNPRTTFVNQWVKKVVQRYKDNPAIVGFQIWNEPNMLDNSDNVTLDMSLNAVNYVEMLAAAYSVVKDIAPSKLVLNASTTAINQNYPETFNYNKSMRDAGAQAFVDRWAIHYYGKQYENVIRDGGIRDFLNDLGMTIWITESGAQGVNSQLPYVEEVWPYLREKVPTIDRIYLYQFTDAAPSDVTYGLRTVDPNFPVSDLYVHLRDR